MLTCETPEEAFKAVRIWKRAGETIGLVPTMGCLHEGHKSLIDASVRETDHTIVSLFVNPAQFGPGEDYDAYPRDYTHDKILCECADVSLLFHPSAERMYRPDFSTYVDMTTMTDVLCGKTRPNHFRGVCTILCKLFHIFGPDRVYFGQKDAQQLLIVRHMIRDLDFPIDLVGCPIVREPSGLALSSRNRYLSPEERRAALCLSRAVILGKSLVLARATVPEVLTAMHAAIDEEPLAKLDYLEAVSQDTLEPIDSFDKEPYVVALAVYIGKTRLIDNFMGGNVQ